MYLTLSQQKKRQVCKIVWWGVVFLLSGALFQNINVGDVIDRDAAFRVVFLAKHLEIIASCFCRFV